MHGVKISQITVESETKNKTPCSSGFLPFLAFPSFRLIMTLSPVTSFSPCVVYKPPKSQPSAKNIEFQA